MTRKPLEESRTQTIEAVAKALEIIDLLLRADFVHGLSPTDVARATGLTAPTVSRHLATLEGRGFAERVPETGRVRISHRIAQRAVSLLNSLDAAQRRIDESRARLMRAN